jgi:hypothetical protein
MYYSLSTTLVVLIAFRSVEGFLWGAEQRFELGPAVQQADALHSEPRHPLKCATRHSNKPRVYSCFNYCVLMLINQPSGYIKKCARGRVRPN